MPYFFKLRLLDLITWYHTCFLNSICFNSFLYVSYLISLENIYQGKFSCMINFISNCIPRTELQRIQYVTIKGNVLYGHYWNKTPHQHSISYLNTCPGLGLPYLTFDFLRAFGYMSLRTKYALSYREILRRKVLIKTLSYEAKYFTKYRKKRRLILVQKSNA